VAPSTVRQIHAILRRALAQGVKWGWLPSNPAALASPPKVVQHDVQPPSPEEVARLSCKPYLAQERCGSGILTAMSTSTPRPRCVADLVELERQGHRLKLLFFWGHQPPRTGACQLL
jgi:integrase